MACTQKKILETGTDMEKVATIEDIIKESWDGMAIAMSNTPTGQAARLKNTWGDVSEIVGKELTPGVTDFYRLLNNKMPGVSRLVERAAGHVGIWLEDISVRPEGTINKVIG